jgi:hypothetical protein
VQTPSVALPQLSEEFRASALAERAKLIDRYEEARRRHEELLAQATEAALDAERHLKTIRELGELLGVEDQLSITQLTPELRGERLREVAADIVFRHFGPGDPPFHYKQWLELVVAEGHRVGGKNQSATFLTQVAHVDGVVRVGRRTGLYQVVATG